MRPTSPGASDANAGIKQTDELPNEEYVLWTIANKYYTADVHFEIHEFDRFRVLHAVGVPAIIYVWGPGEVSLPALRSPRGVPRFIESARAHGSAVSGARPRDCAEGAAL